MEIKSAAIFCHLAAQYIFLLYSEQHQINILLSLNTLEKYNIILQKA